VYFHGQSISANVYDRNLLRAGNRVRGPAIVIQMDSTTVIHPGHVGGIDEYLNILINTEAFS
jgi:N-methylhydantoinase A